MRTIVERIGRIERLGHRLDKLGVRLHLLDARVDDRMKRPLEEALHEGRQIGLLGLLRRDRVDDVHRVARDLALPLGRQRLEGDAGDRGQGGVGLGRWTEPGFGRGQR